MTNTKYLKAISYEEDDEYMLVKAMRPGNNGTVMAVRSLRDGELYFRKVVQESSHLARKGCPPYEGRILQYLEAHPRIMPLISWQKLPPKLGSLDEYSLIHPFYNGGDLTSFHDSYRTARRRIPEVFIWHFAVSMIEALGYLHLGWRKGMSLKTLDKTRLAIGHLDIHGENVLLHWHSDTAILPDVILADFGEYGVFAPPWNGDKCSDLRDDPLKVDVEDDDTGGLYRQLRFDLMSFGDLLKDLGGKYDSDPGATSLPFMLREWTRKLGRLDFHTNQNCTIAEVIRRLYPIATEQVRRLLRADPDVDLRWTRPESPNEPILFNDPDPASNHLLEEFTPPWKWKAVPVSEEAYQQVCAYEQDAKNVKEKSFGKSKLRMDS